MTMSASRHHDFCMGHRVVGHEGKCRHLHGHNYRVHFEVTADHIQDDIGRVIDFSVIKSQLCEWLEENWDHRFMAWEQDPMLKVLAYNVPMHKKLDSLAPEGSTSDTLLESIVFVPFNPTAENMAKHLVEVVAPKQFEGYGVTLVKCSIEETRKCTATFYKE